MVRLPSELLKDAAPPPGTTVPPKGLARKDKAPRRAQKVHSERRGILICSPDKSADLVSSTFGQSASSESGPGTPQAGGTYLNEGLIPGQLGISHEEDTKAYSLVGVVGIGDD